MILLRASYREAALCCICKRLIQHLQLMTSGSHSDNDKSILILYLIYPNDRFYGSRYLKYRLLNKIRMKGTGTQHNQISLNIVKRHLCIK